MKLLPRAVAAVLAAAADRLFDRLPPHPWGGDLLNEDGSFYIERRMPLRPHWWTLGISIRVHRLHSPDPGRHLHTHPSWCASLVLANGYDEALPLIEDPADAFAGRGDIGRELVMTRALRAGDLVFRPAAARHTIAALPNGPALSVFVMGPHRVSADSSPWGFWTPSGYVSARDYRRLFGKIFTEEQK